MKKRNTILTALLIAATSSIASPVMPGHKKTITLADGTSLVAEQHGDEFMSWWEAADGRRYVPADGDGSMYVEADMDAMLSGAKEARRHISMRQADIANRIDNAFNRRNDAMLRGIGDRITYTGKKKGLIVLVQFTDKKFEPGHDRDYYEAVANQPGLTSDEGYVGSVRDYFLAQSNGQFELTFDVVGPVTMKHGYAYYGANVVGKTDYRVGEMISEASDAAAPQVNLADYDWDGDGTADQVFFLYAGLNEAASDDPSTIWPHMYYMRYRSGVLTYDSGRIDTYACASELNAKRDSSTGKYTKETRPSGIGAICHEFSHCLGFPDMYDTNGQRLYGMGYYDPLSVGCYLGNSFVPCNFTAWERTFAGWVDPIEIDRAATVKAMHSAADYGRPLIMHSDSNADEYYLFENRQKSGWDAKLYGKGLMITHVDYDKDRWSKNIVNAYGQDHQRCTIFHADNNDSMNSPADISGDLYPYSPKDGSAANNSLTDSSTPAATLWNSHDASLGTSYMGKPVTDITLNADGTIAMSFMGGNRSNIIDNSTETGISAPTTSARRPTDKRVFAIDGRMVATSTANLPSGIYIVGGKKIVR